MSRRQRHAIEHDCDSRREDAGSVAWHRLALRITLRRSTLQFDANDAAESSQR